MESSPARPQLLLDRAVTTEGTHEVRHDRAAGRSRARSQALILILRLERRSEIDGIDVHLLKRVVAVLSHKFDTEHRCPRKADLRAAIPLHGFWKTAGIFKDRQRRGAFGGQAARSERLELSVPHGEISDRGRILNLRVNRVSAGAIEEKAAACPQYKLLTAG